MNKMYKVVFNKALGRFVVASEKSKSKTKSSRSKAVLGGILMATMAMSSVPSLAANTLSNAVNDQLYGEFSQVAVLGGQLDNINNELSPARLSLAAAAFEFDPSFNWHLVAGKFNQVTVGDNANTASVVLGNNNKAIDGSTRVNIIGETNEIVKTGNSNVIGAFNHIINADDSTAIGFGNYIESKKTDAIKQGIAIGVSNTVNQSTGAAIGTFNKVNSRNGVVVGNQNTIGNATNDSTNIRAIGENLQVGGSYQNVIGERINVRGALNSVISNGSDFDLFASMAQVAKQNGFEESAKGLQQIYDLGIKTLKGEISQEEFQSSYYRIIGGLNLDELSPYLDNIDLNGNYVSGVYNNIMASRVKVMGDENSTMGVDTFLWGNKHVALGNNLTNKGMSNTSIGGEIVNQGTNNSLFGFGSSAKGNKNNAMGNSLNVQGDKNALLGNNLSVIGKDNTSLGVDATVEGQRNIAIAQGLSKIERTTQMYTGTPFIEREGFQPSDVFGMAETLKFYGKFLPNDGFYNLNSKEELDAYILAFQEIIPTIPASELQSVGIEFEQTYSATLQGIQDKTEELRAQGKTDEEILDYFYAEYLATYTQPYTTETEILVRNPSVKGNDVIAMGSGVMVDADQAIAIGMLATATAQDAIAIGTNAISTHEGSIALGANSVANGETLTNEAFLVGGIAQAEMNIGNRRITGVAAGALDTDAANVGQVKAVDTKVNGLSDMLDSVFEALGNPDSWHVIKGRYNNIAIPDSDQNRSVVLGNSNKADADSSRVNTIGSSNSFERVLDVSALGSNNYIKDARNSVAVGNSNTIESTGQEGWISQSSAFGYNNTITQNESTALGVSNQVHAGLSTVIGAQNKVGDGVISNSLRVFGRGLDVSGVSQTVLGDNAKVRGGLNSVMINTSEFDVFANLAKVAKENGFNEAHDAFNEIYDIGLKVYKGEVTLDQFYEDYERLMASVDFEALAPYAMLVEDELSSVNGVVNNVMANLVTVNGDKNSVIGSRISVDADNAIALGTDVTVSADHGIAIGTNTAVSHAGSIALGANSVANGETLTNEAFLVGGTAQAEMNIGNRRITGVAAGALDTDAANVGQVKAVDTKVNDLTTSVSNTLTHIETNVTNLTSTVGGINTIVEGHTTQIGEINNALTNMGTTVGDQIGEINTSIGGINTSVTNLTSIVGGHTGDINTLTQNYNVLNAVAVRYDDANKASLTLGGANGTIIHNVAEGTADTDAVNVKQLNKVAEDVATLVGGDFTQITTDVTNLTNNYNTLNAVAVRYDSADKARITLGGANGTVIGNVATGTADTDAVNVAQLTKATDDLATVIGGDLSGINTSVTNLTSIIGDHTTQIGDINTSIINMGTTIGDQIGAINTSIGGINTVIEGHTTQISDINTTINNLGDSLGEQIGAVNTSVTNLTSIVGGHTGDINTLTQNYNTLNAVAVRYDSADKARITLGGANGTVIGNVATGTADTDAVNVAQLTKATDDLATVIGGDLSGINTSVTNLTSIIGDHTTQIGDINTSIVNMGTTIGDQIGAINTSIGGINTTINNLGDTLSEQIGAVNTSVTNLTNVVGGHTTDINTLTQNYNVLNAVAVRYDDANKASLTLGGANGTIIHNVAEGTADTDAVNVKQLNKVAEDVATLVGGDFTQITTDVTNLTNNYNTLNAVAVRYDSADKARITLGGANGTVIGNVATGTADTDAVNVKQLNKVAEDVATLVGGNLTQITTDVTNLTSIIGDHTTQIGEINTNIITLGDTLGEQIGAVNTSVTNLTNVVGGHTTDINTLTQNYNVLNTVAVRYDDANKASLTLGGANGTVIHNVAEGTADTDAVNVKQLTKATDNLAASIGGDITQITTDVTNLTTNYNTLNAVAVRYDDANKGSLTLGGANGTIIHNVAAGTADTDAVNVKQLTKATDDLATAIGGDLTEITTNVTNLSSTVGGLNNLVEGHTTQIGAINTNIGSINTSIGDLTNIFNGLNESAVRYSSNGGIVSYNMIELAGSNGTVIRNVAAGTQTTDAVNFGQLTALKNELTTRMDSISAGNINLDEVKELIREGDAATLDKAKQDATTKVNEATQASNEKAAELAKAAEDNANKYTDDAVVRAGNGGDSNKEYVDAQDKVTLDKAAELVQNSENKSTTYTDSRVTEALNASYKHTDTSIANLKKDSYAYTDLKATETLKQAQAYADKGDIATLQAAKDYTDQRINDLESSFYEASKENRSGIAAALAIGNLPQPVQGGQNMVSVGMGTFKGEQAIAVGFSAVTEDQRYIFKFGGSADSSNNMAGSASVGFMWK